MRGEFVVEIDASDYWIGGILQQDYDHGLQPIVYYNKKLTSAPCEYSTHEHELLAIVVVVKRW